ncbi:hypothetical protein PR048_010125 [Dryococelus australis]|uniref:Uncharacterized protein n=1 Tax=Dryococelus australis TaxID=614101 RepID=A0ABQ9I2M2_9NEOP|nr:hypothetical protein PR048_010125 [Dryococelus australis]
MGEASSLDEDFRARAHYLARAIPSTAARGRRGLHQLASGSSFLGASPLHSAVNRTAHQSRVRSPKGVAVFSRRRSSAEMLQKEKWTSGTMRPKSYDFRPYTRYENPSNEQTRLTFVSSHDFQWWRFCNSLGRLEIVSIVRASTGLSIRRFANPIYRRRIFIIPDDEGNMARVYRATKSRATPELRCFARGLQLWQLNPLLATSTFSFAQASFSGRRVPALRLKCVLWDGNGVECAYTLRNETGRGGVVVRLLASHQGEPGSLPDIACGKRAGRRRWSEGFLRNLQFPPLHSPHFTLIGSQDLDIKSHPNLFTHPPPAPSSMSPRAAPVCPCCSRDVDRGGRDPWLWGRRRHTHHRQKATPPSPSIFLALTYQAPCYAHDLWKLPARKTQILYSMSRKQQRYANPFSDWLCEELEVALVSVRLAKQLPIGWVARLACRLPGADWRTPFRSSNYTILLGCLQQLKCYQLLASRNTARLGVPDTFGNCVLILTRRVLLAPPVRQIISSIVTCSSNAVQTRSGLDPRPGHSGLGIVPNIAVGRWYFSFSGISRFPRPFILALLRSILTSVTLIGSEDLAVECRPNFFTHSLTLFKLLTFTFVNNISKVHYPYEHVILTGSLTEMHAIATNIGYSGLVVRSLASHHSEAGSIASGIDPRIIDYGKHGRRFRKSVGFLETSRFSYHRVTSLLHIHLASPLLPVLKYFRRCDHAAIFVWAGETGVARENPHTSGIVQHDSHVQKSGGDLAGNQTRLALVVGKLSNYCITRQWNAMVGENLEHPEEALRPVVPAKSSKLPAFENFGVESPGNEPDLTRTTQQGMFDAFSLLSIEADTLRKISVEDPFKAFVNSKIGFGCAGDTAVGFAHYQHTGGSGGTIASALVPLQGDPGSFPSGIASGLSHVRIVLTDAACRRALSGYPRLPLPGTSAPLHPRVSLHVMCRDDRHLRFARSWDDAGMAENYIRRRMPHLIEILLN